MKKLLITSIVAAVVIVAGWQWWMRQGNSPAQTISPTPTVSSNNSTPHVILKSYTSQALNISFKYPASWTIKEETVFPGSAQSETTVTLANGSDVIYAFVKRDCVQDYTYCKAVGDRWPSFSTISTNPEVRLVIDGIIKTAVLLR